MHRMWRALLSDMGCVKQRPNPQPSWPLQAVRAGCSSHEEEGELRSGGQGPDQDVELQLDHQQLSPLCPGVVEQNPTPLMSENRLNSDRQTNIK